jgi:hypothetical protein
LADADGQSVTSMRAQLRSGLNSVIAEAFAAVRGLKSFWNTTPD